MALNLRMKARPERDQAREELAAAIERHTAAVRRLAANEQATSAAEELVYDAQSVVEKRETAVEQAKSDAARHLTDSMIGTDSAPPASISDARVALAEAQDALNAARGALEALRTQRKPAEDEVAWSRTFVLDRKLAAVVQESPNVAKLLAEFATLQRELEARRAVLSFLDSKSAIPIEHSGWHLPRTFPHDAAGIALWRNALAALEADPDAVLPT